MTRFDDTSGGRDILIGAMPHLERPSQNPRTALRREIAQVLGGREQADPRKMRGIFDQGMRIVADLEHSHQIDDETAAELREAFTLLYLNALVSHFSDDLFGRPKRARPGFVDWLALPANMNETPTI